MDRWAGLAALGAVLVLYLGVGLFDHAIWSPTEPATSGVVWEMARHGELAVPRINDFLFLEKPPLYYWLALGASEAAGALQIGWIRLPAALAGLACLGLVFVITRRLYGSAVATITTLLGATCVQLFLISHRASTDVLAILFVFAAWAVFVRGLASAGPRWPFDLALAAVLAGSFYAKNLFPALVALPPIVVWLLWQRELRRVVSLGLAGLVLSGLAVAPWALALHGAGGDEFLRIVFVDNTIGRFLDLDSSGLALRPLNDAYVTERDGGVLYYVPVLLLLGAPWLGFAYAGVYRLYRGVPTGDGVREDVKRFLRIALITVPLVLTAASTRVSNYLDPLLFVVLLIIAEWLHTLFTRPEQVGALERGVALATLGLLAALAVAAPIALLVLVGAVAAAVVALAVGAGALLVWRLRKAPLLSPRPLLALGTGACLLYAVVAAVVIPVVDERKSSEAFFALIGEDARERRIYTDFLDVTKLPLLNFHLDRRVEVEKDPARLAQALASPEPTALIIRPSLYEREQARFAAVPHESRRAASGKGRRSFVYLANRPLEESLAVP